ncbi:MAG: hypothetical protein ABIO81_01170 [Ginsengibacter sp.]
MYCRFCKLLILFYALIFYSIKIFSQTEPVRSSGKKQTINNQKKGLFDNDEILHFKLTGKLADLFNDRKQNIAYHPVLLQYERNDSSTVSIQIKAKARGNFRRLKANCKMPPLMLNLPKELRLKNSIFEKQTKLKLVVPCQGDEYVIREWLVYKLYNLITEKSFRSRLALVDFVDSAGQRKTETLYCILLEDEIKLAERNKVLLIEKTLQMENINRIEFTRMAVFQYMIANTDWSIPFMQNIKLIKPDSTGAPLAIPYDFDHAGIVNAPYAGAAPELEITSILQRIYRGYCNTNKLDFTETFEFFNRLKNDIYGVYTNCALLNPKYVKFVTRFLDDFYKTINNDKLINEEFNKPCRTNIRIELKGLKD